ncbi:hypothetical protein [Pseudonocardia sp. NPDC049154]
MPRTTSCGGRAVRTAIVEHDLYPAPPGAPLPIAARTCRYYTEQGLTGGR